MPVATRAMKAKIVEQRDSSWNNPFPLYLTNWPTKTYGRFCRQKVEASPGGQVRLNISFHPGGVLQLSERLTIVPAHHWSYGLPFEKLQKKVLRSKTFAPPDLWPRINYRKVPNDSILHVLPFHPDAVVQGCSFPFLTTDGEVSVKVKIFILCIPSPIHVECLNCHLD